MITMAKFDFANRPSHPTECGVYIVIIINYIDRMSNKLEVGEHSIAAWVSFVYVLEYSGGRRKFTCVPLYKRREHLQQGIQCTFGNLYPKQRAMRLLVSTEHTIHNQYTVEYSTAQ